MAERPRWLQELKGWLGAPRFLLRRGVVAAANAAAAPVLIGSVQSLRARLLGLTGMRLGPGSIVSEHLYLHDGRNVTIGANARLGTHCRIYDFAPIRIGDHLLASHNVTLISASHHLADLADKPGPITIGDHVWLGINVTIVGPVTIGDHAVIGAGSLVTSDVPANAIYAGTPARLIRMRTPAP